MKAVLLPFAALLSLPWSPLLHGARAQEFYNIIPDVAAGNAVLEQYKSSADGTGEATSPLRGTAPGPEDPAVQAIASTFRACQARAQREHAAGSSARGEALQACEARMRAQVRDLADSRR